MVPSHGLHTLDRVKPSSLFSGKVSEPNTGTFSLQSPISNLPALNSPHYILIFIMSFFRKFLKLAVFSCINFPFELLLRLIGTGIRRVHLLPTVSQ